MRAVNIPPDVEALFTGKEEEMFAKLTEEGRKAIEEDGADVILLGSTTMHQAGEYMSAHLPAPVINPGPVAIKMAEVFVQLGLSHSKVAFPPPSCDHRRPLLLAGGGRQRWSSWSSCPSSCRPEIAFGKAALGRESGRPPMSCLLGILCQATFEGIHSVANIENSRFAPSAPQSGHGGADVAKADTSSSNSHPALQRSGTRRSAWRPSLTASISFAALAAAQGIEPSDDDLGEVLGFLDVILPELDRLEELLEREEAP